MGLRPSRRVGERAAEEARAEMVAAERFAKETKDAADRELERTKELRDDLIAVCAELVEVQKTAKLAEPLAQAEVRLTELEPQRKAIAVEIAETEEQLARLREPVLPAPAGELEPVRRRVQDAEREERSCQATVAVCEARLATARQARARVAALGTERSAAELGTERSAAEEELGDWNRLRRGPRTRRHSGARD
jgi:hypothetical protein